jgi:hypothetical protein
VVSAGDAVFTLIGFVGLYTVLGLLFLVLVGREISRGPVDTLAAEAGKEPAVPDLVTVLAETTELVTNGREIRHVPGNAQLAGHGKEPLQ